MNTKIPILLTILLIIPLTGWALGPELFDTPEQTPIDGGLGILAAVGGLYAVKKLKDRKE